MNTRLQRMALVDVLRYVGSHVVLPTADRSTARFLLTSADVIDDRIVLGLGNVSARMPAEQKVRLWEPKTKVAFARASGGNKMAQPSVEVPASQLGDFIGCFVFVDGGSTPGPHRLLSVDIDNGEVVLGFTAEEAIAAVDHRVMVDTGDITARAA